MNETVNALPEQAGIAETVTVEEVIDLRELVVFNDDVNTFVHVIKTLVRVCRHTPEQAEQCAWIIHHNGKCTVKSGSYATLKPLREAITEAGIDARIL